MSKVLVIFGGGRGIGAATARLAVRDGYQVVVTYQIDRSAAELLAKEIGAFCVQGDVANPQDVSRMFDAAYGQFGQITHVVNSAGITGKSARLDAASLQDIKYTLDTNVWGTILVAREAVKRMSTLHGGQGGVIVNLSSGAASLGSAGEFVWYAASKGAVDSFTVGLGREVALEGIRVCAVAPGLVETELHARSTGEPGRVDRMKDLIPVKRPGTAEEVAESILFLLSDAASYVTATTLRVSGGR